MTVLYAVYYSLCRRRSPPASWTGAAVALAALRTVRPLAEPLTSGAESRLQYQPHPTWLLLMSHSFREFTLVYSSGLLLTSSGACSASFNLHCVSSLFIRSILWFKEFPLMNNTEWARIVFIRNHVVIMICPNCWCNISILGLKTDQSNYNITHRSQFLQNNKRGNIELASLFSLLYIFHHLIQWVDLSVSHSQLLWCPSWLKTTQKLL